MAQVKKEYIKNRIIEVTKEALLKEGYEAVSIRYISKEVGISISNLYNYYKNKESILDDIIGNFYSKYLDIESLNIPQPPSFSPNSYFDYLNQLINDFIPWIKENKENIYLLLN